VTQGAPLRCSRRSVNRKRTRRFSRRMPKPSPAPDSWKPLARFSIVSLRVLSWPLTGLITEAAIPALLAAVAVVSIVVLRWRAADPSERVAIRWLGLGLGWTCLFLTIAAPSLAVVIPDLPNDHYHAFADPMVVIVIGLGVGAACRAVLPRRTATADTGAASPGPSAILPRILVGVAVALLCVWNLATQPPAVNPDGGFPAAAMNLGQVVTEGSEYIEISQWTNLCAQRPDTFPIQALVVSYLRNAFFLQAVRSSSDLQPADASGPLVQSGTNLPQALLDVYTNDRPRFARIEAFVKAALPDAGELARNPDVVVAPDTGRAFGVPEHLEDG